MMRWLVYGLLAAIAGAGLTVLISKDSGYILVSIGRYTLETSFWFGLTVLLLVWGIWRIVRRISLRFYNAIASSVSWLSESKSRRLEQRSSRGMMYFFEGHWEAAKKELLSATRLTDKPLLQYLAAAKSALELGDKEEALFLIQQAEQHSPEDNLAILLAQAQLAFYEKDYVKSIESLQRAQSLEPSHPVVLNLLKSAYLQSHDWQSLIDLYPQIKNTKTESKESLQLMEESMYSGYLETALSKIISKSNNIVEKVSDVWKSIPGPLRKNPRLVEIYVRSLLDHGLNEEALSTLTSTLKNQWSDALILLYSFVTPKDKKAQLLTAEGWIKGRPQDPLLLMILGRLARNNALWGKSREYYEKSVAVNPTVEAYAELADLFAFLGENKTSTECYRKGIALSARTLGKPIQSPMLLENSQ